MQTKNNSLGNAHQFIFWRGIFLILFGIIAFFWSGLALWALILTFGLFAIIDGAILIGMYFKHHHVWGSSSLWLGIVSILIGLYALFFPSLTAIALALFIALRAILVGVFELRMGTHLKKHIASESLLIVNGILSILFAIILLVLLFSEPALALLVLVEILGIYAICLGILLLVLSSRVKKAGIKELKNATEMF